MQLELGLEQVHVQAQEEKVKASQILRETKVPQTTGSYVKGEAFCAMGAIMHYFGWNGEYGSDRTHYCEDRMSELLPAGAKHDVVVMNDDYGKSFSEIADWLESKGL